MESQTIRQLRQNADEISRIQNGMFQKQCMLYSWSIAGNISSILATYTAGRSLDLLSSLLYIGRYVVLLFRLRPLEKEITSSEDEIDHIFHEARVIAELNDSVNAGPLKDGKSSLRCSSLLLFVLDLLQRRTGSTRNKAIDVTEDSNRLFRGIPAVIFAIGQQKKEIEHLPPMLQNIKVVIEDMGRKTAEVVKAVPNVRIPEDKPIPEALLNRKIEIKPHSTFSEPERHKKYPDVSSKIETARKHKRDFQRNAFGTVKRARKCLQASEEAKTLPTYQLIKTQSKNIGLLNEMQECLKAIESFENETKQLHLKNEKNQHSVATHVTKILHAASDAFDNLNKFDVDIKSKLEQPNVRETAKRVQEQAEEGGRVSKFVNDAVSSMTQANQAMNDVEKESTSFFRSGIKANKILPSVGNTEDWEDRGDRLAMSVDELAKHAHCIKENPEKIINGSFTNNKPALVSQTTEVAKESLEMSDKVLRVLDQENGSRNSPGQFRVLERVFHRVWPGCEHDTDIQQTTMEIRSEAQKLRSKINEPDESANEFNKLSFVINGLAIIFDLYKFFTLRRTHPKEAWLREEIERIIRNDNVAGRRN
ncbi:uncharacterized protein LOC123564917 [Mercenaria mercenaria]|uniref:uncharacterized protein LOC123564917 n=1 Tax=Mercenaria mercenaria TaxID=6596 RepID=UPI00234E83F3|nr:uncharacterized protein LOC123564917 [Mercenaria mercenaria]